jgi:hypothetical protein
VKKINSIPFNFVLENLFSTEPIVRPMFGCHAVYVRGKIVLVLRDKKDHTLDNGIWIATKVEHHASLQLELPSMRSIHFLGKAPTNWQNLPADSIDFEESALHVCALILKNDSRVGTIPKPQKRKLR